MFACLGATADAAQCGSTAAGFEAWKREFAEEARAKGVSGASIAALLQTSYATATIAADRGQRSFGLSLDQFMAKRGASANVARGRGLKQSQAALFTCRPRACHDALGHAASAACRRFSRHQHPQHHLAALARLAQAGKPLPDTSQ